MRSVSRGLLFAVSIAASGCYRGAGETAAPSAVAANADWKRVDVPFVPQRTKSDCGAAALSSVLAYWGRPTSPSVIERAIGRREGTTAGDLQRYARGQGLDAFVLFANVGDLRYELERGRPVIVGVVKRYAPREALTHYQVVVGFDPRRKRVLALDPADGLREYPLDGFLAEWNPTRRVAMVTFERAAATGSTDSASR